MAKILSQAQWTRVDKRHFGLGFSEKVQFPVLFGLYSHGNVDNYSENAIFQYFPHFTAIFGALN